MRRPKQQSHRKDIGDRLLSSSLTNQTDADKTIQRFLEDNSKFLEEGPIESLLMLSPALHPGEFQYFTAFSRIAASETLKLIVRKGIVYSLYDRANGWAFNLRDTLLNTQIAQYFQATISLYDQLGEDTLPTTAFRSLNVGNDGPPALGYSLAYGALYYAFSLAAHAPADLLHHINHNTFNGHLAEPTGNDSVFLSIGKNAYSTRLTIFCP